MAHTGLIILLNGTSSSGKTTVSMALQEALDEPYLYASLDGFLHLFPESFLADRDRLLAKFPELIHAFHATATALSLAGTNVILDHVLQYPEWLHDILSQTCDVPVLFVGLRCPLEELERRETQRGDRDIGLARAQYDKVHSHGTYDLELDTSVQTVEECVAAIAHLAQSGAPTRAFRTLRSRV